MDINLHAKKALYLATLAAGLAAACGSASCTQSFWPVSMHVIFYTVHTVIKHHNIFPISKALSLFSSLHNLVPRGLTVATPINFGTD